MEEEAFSGCHHWNGALWINPTLYPQSSLRGRGFPEAYRGIIGWLINKKHKSIGRSASCRLPQASGLPAFLCSHRVGGYLRSCITSPPSPPLDNKKHLENEQRVQNTPIPTPEELGSSKMKCALKNWTVLCLQGFLSPSFLVESIIITFFVARGFILAEA